MMDAVSEMTGEDVAPTDGDVSMCLNCGAFYTLQGDAWTRLTPEQYAALEPDVRCQLSRARRVQQSLGRRPILKDETRN
jgi:hypothetical protein